MTSIAKWLLITMVSTTSLNAMAKGSESEFWYRPNAGQFAISLDATSRSMKFEIKQAGTKVGDFEISQMPMAVGFSYGIAQDHAIGVSTDFGTDKLKANLLPPFTPSESKDTGMGDLKLTYDGRSGPIYFGAKLGINLSKSKSANSGPPEVDGNRSSGGMSLTPTVGYHHSMGSMAFGAKLIYAYLMERTQTDQATPEVESKITGGNSFSLIPYFEFTHGLGDTAIYLDYWSTSDSTVTPTGGTGTDSGGRKTTTLGVKGNLNVASSVDILYDLGYSMVSDFNASSVFDKASGSVMSLGAGVRMMF